jgi:hypothetical protein
MHVRRRDWQDSADLHAPMTTAAMVHKQEETLRQAALLQSLIQLAGIRCE